MTARLTITLADEIFEQVKSAKPAHRPMSQHIADLLIKALEAKNQKYEAFSLVLNGNSRPVEEGRND